MTNSTNSTNSTTSLSLEQISNAVKNAINHNESWLFNAFYEYCDDTEELSFYSIEELADFFYIKNKDVFEIKDELVLVQELDEYFYFSDTIYAFVSFTHLSEDLAPINYYFEEFIEWLSKKESYVEFIKTQSFELEKLELRPYFKSIKDKLANGEITKIFINCVKSFNTHSFYNFYVYDTEYQDLVLINELYRYENNEVFHSYKPTVLAQGSYRAEQKIREYLQKFCTKEIIANIKIEAMAGCDTRFV